MQFRVNTTQLITHKSITCTSVSQVHVNEAKGGAKTAAYMLQYDSVHGKFGNHDCREAADGKSFTVDGKTVRPQPFQTWLVEGPGSGFGANNHMVKNIAIFVSVFLRHSCLLCWVGADRVLGLEDHRGRAVEGAGL